VATSLGSHDLEDIVTVFDGRAELPGEIAQAPADVRDYIAAELGALLDNRDFLDALSGFLPPDAASQRRRLALEARLREIAAI
jgi:hypothetical protein